MISDGAINIHACGAWQNISANYAPRDNDRLNKNATTFILQHVFNPLNYFCGARNFVFWLDHVRRARACVHEHVCVCSVCICSCEGRLFFRAYDYLSKYARRV